MPPEIRECREGDLKAVYEIEKMSFPHPYDLDVFQAYLLRVEFSGFDGFLVAVEGETVQGYVIFEYGRKALIVSMAVHPDRRRGKIGTLLLREALLRIGRRCKEITLQVAVSNLGARHLYRAFGFEVMKTIPRYYPDGEDALLMERS